MIDAILILTGKRPIDDKFLEASEYLRRKIHAHKACSGCVGTATSPVVDPRYHNEFRADMFLPQRRDASTITDSCISVPDKAAVSDRANNDSRLASNGGTSCATLNNGVLEARGMALILCLTIVNLLL